MMMPLMMLLRPTRRYLAGCVLLVALFFSASAHADPLALRAPVEARSVAVAGAFPYLSAGFRFDNGIGVAVTTRFPLTSLSADVGYRRLLIGTEEGWSLAASIWSGFTMPFAQPALVLDVGIAVHGRYRRGWFVLQFGEASPSTFRLTGDFLARIPLAVDLWMGAQLGRVGFGVQGNLGASFLNDFSPTLYYQASVYVAVSL
jgi:hypothetical protein